MTWEDLLKERRSYDERMAIATLKGIVMAKHSSKQITYEVFKTIIEFLNEVEGEEV